MRYEEMWDGIHESGKEMYLEIVFGKAVICDLII